MLYKFKSKVASDVIMLEPNGRQILALWGRTGEESLRKGILLAADMPVAISALEEAIAKEEAQRAQAAWRHKKRGRHDPDRCELAQRARPCWTWPPQHGCGQGHHLGCVTRRAGQTGFRPNQSA
uniref:Uncharacterized protein n=1 Tax=Curvibacter symbiont subsp. Hydra magnipapillata TaxID=667019 RepID=C9YDM5_CURXX|nr:hypothetical protein Csp_F37220 [Curvibacter putative symbiont of Hydra magnipapillata]